MRQQFCIMLKVGACIPSCCFVHKRINILITTFLYLIFLYQIEKIKNIFIRPLPKIVFAASNVVFCLMATDDIKKQFRFFFVHINIS